jgi:hypothetical protein
MKTGNYKHPCYKQYMTQPMLDKLREVSSATGVPMQRLVRYSVASLFQTYNAFTPDMLPKGENV